MSCYTQSSLGRMFDIQQALKLFISISTLKHCLGLCGFRYCTRYVVNIISFYPCKPVSLVCLFWFNRGRNSGSNISVTGQGHTMSNLENWNPIQILLVFHILNQILLVFHILGFDSTEDGATDVFFGVCKGRTGGGSFSLDTEAQICMSWYY